MSRDNPSHMPLVDAHPRKMRDDEPGGLLVSYDAGAGDLRAFPGDDKFPFVLMPPDLGTTANYAKFVPAADGIAYWATFPRLELTSRDPTPSNLQLLARGAAIDVRGIRLLTFYVSLQVDMGAEANVAGTNALTFIPQAGNESIAPFRMKTDDAPLNAPYVNVDPHTRPNLRWYTIGAVDPTIRGQFPTAINPQTAWCAPLYGFRNISMTQLVQPLNPAGKAMVHTTLVFDVTSYEYFRLLYCLQTIAAIPSDTYLFPSATTNPSYEGDFFQLDFQAER